MEEQLARLRRHGVTHVYGKLLAANDNAKQQVYLGSSMDSVQLLPVHEVAPDPKNPKRIKARLVWSWLTDTDQLSAAPGAQLILYPDYPEVRLSGFLRACPGAPSALMDPALRSADRVLLIGVVGPKEQVVAVLLAADSPAAKEFKAQCENYVRHGVLHEVPLTAEDADGGFEALREKLSHIHQKGWIRSYRLSGAGRPVACEQSQCGGYTLEAELGVVPNGHNAPDFLGWEIKQFAVGKLDRRPPQSKALTLITPEPGGGVYGGDFREFMRRWGYPDAKIAGRQNFGGRYFVGEAAHHKTGLALVLRGEAKKPGWLTSSGSVALLAADGTVAAEWSFSQLLQVWSRKHARAAYVPGEKSAEGMRQYRYGRKVMLGRGTTFELLVHAISKGLVYLDPAPKIEPGGAAKRRNQFRVHLKDLRVLYERFETFDVVARTIG